jgi:hypothetical protein
VVNEADLMQTVLALVEAGEGVALVPACVPIFAPAVSSGGRSSRMTVRIPLVMVWPAVPESPGVPPPRVAPP